MMNRDAMKNAAPSAQGNGVNKAHQERHLHHESYALDRLTASLSLHRSTRSAVALLASLTADDAAFARRVQRLEKGARA